jgi:hypothetical protein
MRRIVGAHYRTDHKLGWGANTQKCCSDFDEKAKNVDWERIKKIVDEKII